MLRPFFSFFGSKNRLAKFYPKPRYDMIVEPFAGSAGYSLRYPTSQVVLNDIDPTIVKLWQYLISVSADAILALPDVSYGERVDVLNIPEPAKTLIGFWITESQTYASTHHLSRSRQGSWGQRKREYLAANLEHIRHWRVVNASYTELYNTAATWFVDPPYFYSGKRYRYSRIDYSYLAEWCKMRQGQVIVCEGSVEGKTDPAYLPFSPLVSQMNASNRLYRELFYTRASTPLTRSA